MNKSIGLTAFNNMKSSKIVALQGVEIEPVRYVEVPPVVLDMLSVIESIGLSKDTFQQIVERQYYLLKDDRELTPEQIEKNNEYKTFMSGALDRSLNNAERSFYHSLYQDVPPQTIEEMAQRLHELSTQEGNQAISYGDAVVMVESIRNRIAQKIAGCELVYEDYSKEDYDRARKYCGNIFLTVGKTKRGAIFDEITRDVLETSSRNMIFKEMDKKRGYVSDLADILANPERTKSSVSYQKT